MPAHGTEPSADDKASNGSKTFQRAALTVCVMLATIMQALDTTIANVALPYMQGSLSATLDQINWVLTSYMIAAAIATPPTGWLTNRFGRKRLFLISVAGFTVVSVLCGLAQNIEQMVVFRLLQGVFGAPLVPLSQVVLLDAYPRERHGSAMAIWGIGVMVGPILGPLLGGYLTEYYDWRWVFYVNLPVGVLALLGLWTFMAETRLDQDLRFDWFGFTMLSISIGALQMMLDRGEQLDWFSSDEIIIEAILTGLASYLFIVHTFTARQPFIDPHLFLDRNFSAGLVLITSIGVILFATLALLTPFLENVLNYPVMTTGVVLAPRGIGTMIAMIVVGRIINHTDARLIILIGLCLNALSLYQMTGFSGDVSEETLIVTGVIQGFGLGFVFVPLSAVTFATLEPVFRPQATGLFSLMRNIGSSIGISYVIFLLSHNTRLLHAQITETVTSFGLEARLPAAPALSDVWNPSVAAGRAALDAEITRQASIVAYLDDFKLLMVIALLSLPMVLLLQRARPAPAKT